MAKARNRNGTWVVQIGFRGKRTQISLGKIEESDANYTAMMISRLIETQKSQTSLPPELEVWLQSIPDPLAIKLSDSGIIANQHRRLTIEQLLELFLESYDASEKVSAGTKGRMRTSLARMPDFAKGVRLREIDESLIERIENHVLSNDNWSLATAGRTHGDILQVGNWAKLRRFIGHNPFEGLTRFECVNEDNEKYIEPHVIRQVIATTGCSDLRTIFALARFAGLRIISELMNLTWQDYKPDEQVLIVRKSKRRKDKAKKDQFKVIPLWPYLDRAMLEHFELTAETSSHIITPRTLRATDTALRNRARRAIKRSGQTPWPRIWDNLRHSYAVDVRQAFGVEDGAMMTGHSPEVALKNYRKRQYSTADAIAKGLFGTE